MCWDAKDPLMLYPFISLFPPKHAKFLSLRLDIDRLSMDINHKIQFNWATEEKTFPKKAFHSPSHIFYLESNNIEIITISQEPRKMND